MKPLSLGMKIALGVVVVAVLAVVLFPKQRDETLFQSVLAYTVWSQPEVDPTGGGRSKELRAWNQMMKAGEFNGDPEKDGWDELRKTIMEGFVVMLPPFDEVDKKNIHVDNGGHKVLVVVQTPPKVEPGRVILFSHGGGMCVGEPRHEYGVVDFLVLHTNAVAYSVDYRLLPDVTVEVAVSDIVATYKYLISKEGGYKPEDIILMGCSGGGMATLFSTLAIGAAGLPKPAGALVQSPALGMEMILPDWEMAKELPSWKREVEHNEDALLDINNMSLAMLKILLRPENKNYVLDLMEKHSKDLPPTLVQAGQEELVSSIDFLTYEYLKKRGGNVEWDVMEKLGHCYSNIFSRYIPEAKAYFDKYNKWLIARWNDGKK